MMLMNADPFEPAAKSIKTCDDAEPDPKLPVNVILVSLTSTGTA